ncbi:MAG: patatin-like phospholipase family protein [Saprospiraceae bacterium]|nr:patatin-like phospholipase family protein [Saprospiraceae bacterium]
MKAKNLFLVLFIIVLLFSNNSCNNIAKEDAIESAVPKTIILAVDGGGIKGIIPAIFLDAIEDSLGKQSYQLFDLIGGTSTGGLISVALTSNNVFSNNNRPFTGNQIVQIYQKNGSNIFVPQNCKVETCATYYANNNNGKGIEPFLQQMVGVSTTLSDSYQFIQGLSNNRVKQMFTTSYIVNSTGGAISNPVQGQDYGPYLFNWYDANASANNNYYAWEAARGTSAAPTYFPIAHVGGGQSPRSGAAEKWVVDGGMMSNDPAVWGITEAIRTGIATSLQNIIVISLGTGFYPGDAGVGINNEGSLVPSDGNWSETPWIFEKLYDLEGAENDRGTIINVILDAVQMVTDSQLNELKKSGLQYYRLEPTLSKSQSAMDNISPANIDSLIATANNYLKTSGAATFSNIITALKSN